MPSNSSNTVSPDALAEETEKMVAELFNERAHLFTLAEVAWLNTFVNKLRWGTNEQQERKYQDVVRGIRQLVEERKVSG